MGTSAWISLGSNLGDREGLLRMALDVLDGSGYAIQAVSSWYETVPRGGPGGQPPFLNGAAEIDVPEGLSPEAFLLRLNQIELLAGRTRDVRWDARTLDLDILHVDGILRNEPNLQLPHPRLGWRRFVLVPLAEIAPNLIDPMTGLTVQRLRDDLDRPELTVCLIGENEASRAVAGHLAGTLPDGTGCLSVPGLSGSDSTPTSTPRLGVMLDGIARRPGLAAYPLLWPEHQTPEAIADEIVVACHSRLP